MPPALRVPPLLVLLSGLLAGCGQPEPDDVREPVVRPVKTMVVAGSALAGVRRFPARIDADQKVDLAFRVPGKIQKFHAKEGDIVEAGQLVAELDPTQYQIAVNDRQAVFDGAAADFERARELVKGGHISRRAFDEVEARYKAARAALEQATTDLSYTKLSAPFGGDLAKRFVEQFEEVEAKQPVVALRNTAVLEVRFDVPESLLTRLQSAQESGEAQGVIPAVASFENAPGKEYPLEYKEFATQADPKTQTFEARYRMTAPQDLLVLPGMTGTVTLDLGAYLGARGAEMLPVQAVVRTPDGDTRVWVVDESSMTVVPRSVRLGQTVAGRVAVAAGLKPGERVVIAGTQALQAGMKVRLLPDLEQAKPRAGDV